MQLLKIFAIYGSLLEGVIHFLFPVRRRSFPLAYVKTFYSYDFPENVQLHSVHIRRPTEC